MTTVIFSHGQESGPWGTKIRAMAELVKGMGCAAESIDYQGIADPTERVHKCVRECAEIDDRLVLAHTLALRHQPLDDLTLDHRFGQLGQHELSWHRPSLISVAVAGAMPSAPAPTPPAPQYPTLPATPPPPEPFHPNPHRSRGGLGLRTVFRRILRKPECRRRGVHRGRQRHRFVRGVEVAVVFMGVRDRASASDRSTS